MLDVICLTTSSQIVIYPKLFLTFHSIACSRDIILSLSNSKAFNSCLKMCSKSLEGQQFNSYSNYKIYYQIH